VPLDFTFDRYEEIDDEEKIEIDFVCSFEGAIPSKTEVMDNLVLCFDFDPGNAKLDRLRPVKGKKQVKPAFPATHNYAGKNKA